MEKILDIIHKLKETKINLRNSIILVSSLRKQDGLERASAKTSLTNQIHLKQYKIYKNRTINKNLAKDKINYNTLTTSHSTNNRSSRRYLNHME